MAAASVKFCATTWVPDCDQNGHKCNHLWECASFTSPNFQVIVVILVFSHANYLPFAVLYGYELTIQNGTDTFYLAFPTENWNIDGLNQM